MIINNSLCYTDLNFIHNPIRANKRSDFLGLFKVFKVLQGFSMNKKSNQLVSNQVLQQFKNPNSRYSEQIRKNLRKSAAKKLDLELALTIILVDVASCDGEFEQSEYHVISCALRMILGSCRTDMSKLVNQAKLALANLRGISRYAQILCDCLEENERRFILQAVENVIMADGREDDFETYMRHKLADLLDIEI